MAWSEEHKTMIQDCINRERKLTAWEQDFITSLQAQSEVELSHPTPTQIDKLDEIWERVT